eukprot:m.95830 g.95830  ORF g.95830 m.95830 type:complete len:50 (-) comp15030_c1_seq2:1517-1666(-)
MHFVLAVEAIITPDDHPSDTFEKYSLHHAAVCCSSAAPRCCGCQPCFNR